MTHPLASILDHIRAEPSRTWSIIITIYGDAIVPRGGCVWLGTLLHFFAALEISEGVVRTAASRLVTDGWLERRRPGRNSYYRLAAKGEGVFRTASTRVYTRHAPPWAGFFELLLPERGMVRPDGAGAPVQGAWLAPSGRLPPDLDPSLRLRVTADPDSMCRLAARSWPLEDTANPYRRFVDAYTPLREAMRAGLEFAERDAMVARILLIHAYRRIVLRDPLLPEAVLPPDWPGAQARALCAEIYPQLLPASERWLDAHAIGEDGAKLRANADIAGRFND